MTQTGIIKMHSSNTAPAGYLVCNGDPIPSQYTALISLIGANTPLIDPNRFIKSGTNPMQKPSASATISATVNVSLDAALSNDDTSVSISGSDSTGNHQHTDNQCNNDSSSYSGWAWHANGFAYGHKTDGSKNNPQTDIQTGLNDHSHGYGRDPIPNTQNSGDHRHQITGSVTGSHQHTFTAGGNVQIEGPDNELRAPSRTVLFVIKT